MPCNEWGAGHEVKAELLLYPSSHTPPSCPPMARAQKRCGKEGRRMFGIEMYIDACRRMKFVVVKSVLAMMMAVVFDNDADGDPSSSSYFPSPSPPNIT